MKTMAPTLKSCLAPSLLPALATLALTTSLWLQLPHAARPTSYDMASAPSELPASAAPVSPAPAAESAAPLDGLPLEHEHLSRIDHLARAQTLRELGDFSGALTECRRALFDTPDDEAALHMIARLGQLSGQQELSVRAFERLGRTGEAQAAYSNATRLSPRYVNARVNAHRMNNLARLDVPPSSGEGLLSQDTGL